MGCSQSTLAPDPLIVAENSGDLCWQSQLTLEIIPPMLMVLVGAFQIISNARFPKPSWQHVPKHRINGVRFALSCIQIIWPFAIIMAHVIDQPHDIPYQLFIVPTLEFVAWSFATYIQILDLRRYMTFPYVLRVFAVAEILVLSKAVVSQILRLIEEAHATDAMEPTTIYFLVLCGQLVCTIAYAAIPSIERIDFTDLWWSVFPQYMMEAKGAAPPGGRPEIGEPLLDNRERRVDSGSLVGDGPLSLHVRLFEQNNSQDGSCAHVWNISNFPLFVIRVKWDKKSVWEVKRRHPDFVLLVNMLETAGLGGKQDFREFVADFSRLCSSPQVEHNMIYKQIKGLNQLLHICTTIPAVKTSGPFRSFITHGQTKLVGEKFNTMLSIYDFDILACVGKGSFGKVFQVRKKDNGNIYALKVLLKKDIKQDSQIRHTKTERQILGDIVHPFICALRYAFQSDTKLYLVLDFFSGGELGIHLEKGKFSEAQARFYCAELILGLEHLHGQNIVYRDLKPGNILLEADGHIKIADFGLSKKFKRGESRAKTFCGTPVYMAPEIIDRQPYSFPVDWWALGVIMFEMMTGDPPFIETNMKRLFKLVLTTEVVYPADMSPAAKSLISGLLKKTPTERLGVTGAKAIQEHEFFQGLDWKALYSKGVTVPFVPTPRRDSRPTNVWPELMEEKLDTTKSVSTGFNHKQFTQFTYNQAETYDTLPNSMRMQEVSSFHDRMSLLDTLELKSQRIESTTGPSRRMGIGEFAAASLAE